MPDEHLGPIDYVVVEFTDANNVRAGFNQLLKLVDQQLIRVLDLEFIHSIDGVASLIEAGRVSKDFAQFEGASSGLLDRHDLNTVAAELAPGAMAAVLVYEDLAVLPVLNAWENNGARIVSEGPVDLDDLDASLEGV